MAIRIFACMLLALCCCADLALADAEADFLAYLSYDGRYQVPDALKAIVQPVGETATVGDVRFTLTGVAYDGVWFALGWVAENLRSDSLAEVYVASIALDGKPLYADVGFPHYEWLPQLFGLHPAGDGTPDGRSVWGMRTRPQRPMQGEVRVEVTVKVGRLREPAVIVDPELYGRPRYDSEQMHARHDAMFSAFEAYGLRVAEAGADPAAVRQAGKAVFDRYGNYYIEGTYYGGFDLFAFEDGHRTMPGEVHAQAPVRDVDEAVLRFTLDADAGRALNDTIEIGTEHQLEGMQIMLNRAVLTPMSTTVDFDILPDQADSPDAARGLLRFYGQLQAVDPDGEPLAFGLTKSAAGTLRRADVEQQDGRWRAVCQVQWPGLMQRPETLHIQPTGLQDEDDRRLHEAFAAAMIVPLAGAQ